MVDVMRRFIYGSEPVSALMMGVGLLALAANVTCLILIAKHREGGVHMRASYIFSVNDVIAMSASSYPVRSCGRSVRACRTSWWVR